MVITHKLHNINGYSLLLLKSDTNNIANKKLYRYWLYT